MTRGLARAVAMAAVLAASSAVLQMTGPTANFFWELLIVAALIVTVWRRVPAQPAAGVPARPIWARHRIRPPASLLSLELEVAGSGDTRMGDDVRLRKRLAVLTAHRGGLGPEALGEESVRELLGADAARVLTGSGPMAPEEVEMLVQRVAAL